VTYYLHVGEVPKKRHTRAFEELIGEQGFVGESSLLYHLRSPSAITSAEPVEVQRSLLEPNQPLLPWHFRLRDLPAGGDMATGRHVLFGNSNVVVCWVAADESSEIYRNAAGDELIYVHSGSATFESVFGVLPVSSGDYVVVPSSTTGRWVLASDAPVEALVFEASGHLFFPERYLTRTGQLKEGAPFCERDLRPPSGPLVVDDAEGVSVLVRARAGWTRYVCAHHPFDVVGWDGCLWPFAFNIADFEPIVGRIHQPPPVHQTFAAPGFVVCSFVPRLYDFDPEAVKVPYHHANVDSDEMIFYCAGDFMSRAGAGIGIASATLHPAGFVHGPQPGSIEAAALTDRTEETAVMMDTFSPLLISEQARSVADSAYPWSWNV
jgi:homogentisate 1,2-dioxygenase